MGAVRDGDIGMENAAFDLGTILDRDGGRKDPAIQAPADDDLVRARGEDAHA